MITDFQEQAKLENQIFTAKTDLKTVIPQIIETVPRVATETWGIINDPASTPTQLQAAFERASSELSFYNTYDNYFKTGTGAYGAVEVPQLLTIADNLKPFLATLQLGMVRAADRLRAVSPDLVPNSPYLDPINLALMFGSPD